MTRHKIVFGAIALLCSSVCMGQIIVSVLDEGSLIPGPGDPDGSAMAGVWIIDEEIHFDVQVEDVALPLTNVQIHQGSDDVNGAAVIDLSAYIDGLSIRGTAPIGPALAADIVADPEGFYLVVRNDDFPAGALRGQFQMQATTPLTADLLAENEVPPLAAGPNGFAQLNLGGFVVTYDVTAEGVEFPMTGHHVHDGPAGVNGPVVVAFDPLAWSGDVNAASARGIVLADSWVVDEILADPAGHYVNVHNETYPAGAIRGQLAGREAFSSIAIPVNANWMLMLIMLALWASGLVAARRSLFSVTVLRSGR